MGFWTVKKGDDLIEKLMSKPMIMLPTKKEFNTMRELLRDAEKFDNVGEHEVSMMCLDNLRQYICEYKLKQESKNGRITSKNAKQGI